MLIRRDGMPYSAAATTEARTATTTELTIDGASNVSQVTQLLNVIYK